MDYIICGWVTGPLLFAFYDRFKARVAALLRLPLFLLAGVFGGSGIEAPPYLFFCFLVVFDDNIYLSILHTYIYFHGLMYKGKST